MDTWDGILEQKTQHRWFKTPSCDKPYHYFDIENIIKFDDVLSIAQLMIYTIN